jgi:hypothetical protein
MNNSTLKFLPIFQKQTKNHDLCRFATNAFPDQNLMFILLTKYF